MNKYKQALGEIKAERNIANKMGESFSVKTVNNPIYSGSSGENSSDMKKRFVASETVTSIIGHSNDWFSPNTAALNFTEEGSTSNDSSSCSPHDEAALH